MNTAIATPAQAIDTLGEVDAAIERYERLTAFYADMPDYYYTPEEEALDYTATLAASNDVLACIDAALAVVRDPRHTNELKAKQLEFRKIAGNCEYFLAHMD
jgi:hypothetical protein